MTDDSTPPRRRSSAGRTVALGMGLALAVVGVLLALGGAGVLAANAALEEDGFVTTPSAHVDAGDVVALTSESLEVREIEDWPFDEDPLQLRVTVSDSAEPVFVGIAPTDDVDDALAGVSRANVSFDDGPLADPSYDERTDGGRSLADPATAVDWSAYVAGGGRQELTWDIANGDWTLVLVNADGSAGVDARVRIGVNVPFLTTIGWSLLATGLAIGLLAALLIAAGARGDEPGGVAMTGTSGPGSLPAGASPLRLEARVDSPGRALWLVKWLLLLPHVIVLGVLWTAVAFVTIFAWFAVVLTGRYPQSAFTFVEGVARWTWRVMAYGYGTLSTDQYPPFSLRDDPDYPARLQLARPERLSRLLPFVKWALLAPHWLLAGAIGGGTYVAANGDEVAGIGLTGTLVLIAGVGLLFTARLPQGMFDLLVGIHRWGWRVFAYGALLVDDYPPFRLDQGGAEPDAGPTLGSTRAAGPPAT